MNKLNFLFALLFFAFTAGAQTPPNDDCMGLIDLGVAPVCNTDTFNNVNATNSDIGFDNAPSCFNGGIAQHDVWFKFTCPDTLFDFRITLSGVGPNTIQNPQFAIYRGDCEFNGLAEFLCAPATIGDTAVYLDVQGLTPGLDYFIRVSDFSVTGTPNWGDFTLCVDEIPPILTIDQGGSTLCEGTLYDSGGPNNDYLPGEDFTFTICPGQTAACITFTLDYYNLEGSLPFFSGQGDQLYFYDGNSTSGNLLAALDGSGFSAVDVAGGGGVAFEVKATSGCLTVQFQSDGSIEQEGWLGHWVCSNEACTSSPDLVVNNSNITNDSIVNSLASTATSITVTNVDCADGAYGTFSFANDQNDLGLGKGLLLTSGDATIAIGPNDLGGAGAQLVPLFNEDPGDADLDYLSVQLGNGTQSFDACIVELDVFVATNELTFEYVFGSEEYPEYVNNNFNDIFAFLVSGPGITGDPNLANAKNIAILPSNGVPVQINSVNNLTNWEYYRNNELSSTIQYDGLTSDYLGVKKSLTARTDVIPCNTYHLKLAVADRSDESFDSGVFVSKIEGGTPSLSIQFANGIDYLAEVCSSTEDQLIIGLSQPLTVATTLIVTIGGTAIQGVDYTLNVPSTITFQPGQQFANFPITVITDNIVEGTEFISITLSGDFGCGTVEYKTILVDVKDNVVVNVQGGDTLLLCAGQILPLLATGATDYFWSPPGAVSNPFIANPNTTALTVDTWLEVTGTVGNCVDIDSVFIKIVNPNIDVQMAGDGKICQGESVQLTAVNNTGGFGLVWTPAEGLSSTTSQTPLATPTQTTTYTGTISVAGCVVKDTVTILVDTLFFPTVIADTTVCQNYPVQLATELVGSTTYKWTPNTGLSADSISNPIALPEQTTTYTLVATSANGYCSQTETVKVTVIAADVDITGAEYRELCLGDTISLTAVSTPAGSQVSWTPPFYLSSPTGSTVSAFPDESVSIYATYNVNGCIVRDSVRIRVDSLPNGDITLVKDKPIYCPGDTIFLISPTYEPANFPDIKIQWEPYGNQQTPDSNWNMVILASQTLFMIRSNINHACVRKDSVEIPVGIIPELTITATPMQLCPGGSSQLLVTAEPSGGTFEWSQSPQGLLSCTECPNPLATPQGTTMYTVEIKDVDCPTSESFTLEVLPAPGLNLPNNPSICPGGSVQLNTVDESPTVTYTWTSVPPGFVSSSATPIVSPAVTTTYKVLAQGPVCDSEQEVTVTVAQATMEAGPAQTICEGLGVTLNATVTGTTNQVQWTWPLGNTTSNTLTDNPIVNTQYLAQLVYGPDCQLFDSVFVTVRPTPVLTGLTFVPDTLSNVCEGEDIGIRVTVTPAGTPLAWFLNGQLIPGKTADSISVVPFVRDNPSRYTVTATSANGCSATAGPLEITARECLDIPNAFTPGNDDLNDTFGLLVTGGSIVIEEFLIFDRWGEKVFEATPGVQSWDGKIDGKEAPAEVYAYYIKYRKADGTVNTKKGDVTLLR